jgi:hypothetical protein
LTQATGTLHEGTCKFNDNILSNFKHYTEYQDTVFVQKLFFEIRAVYEKIWKSMVQTDKPQMTIKYGACAVYAG